jgi:hypothetical protein
MAVQIFLKAVFQRSEQIFTLFGGQIPFIAHNVVHSLTASGKVSDLRNALQA